MVSLNLRRCGLDWRRGVYKQQFGLYLWQLGRKLLSESVTELVTIYIRSAMPVFDYLFHMLTQPTKTSYMLSLLSTRVSLDFQNLGLDLWRFNLHMWRFGLDLQQFGVDLRQFGNMDNWR